MRVRRYVSKGTVTGGLAPHRDTHETGVDPVRLALCSGYEDLEKVSMFRDYISWSSLDGLTKGGDAGYAVTLYHPIVRLATGAVANYDCYIWGALNYLLYQAGKKVRVEFLLDRITATNVNIWLRLDNNTFTPPSETVDHFGFKIVGVDLYASNANGTTQKITDTAVDLVDGTRAFTMLKAVLNPGVDCKFYVNGVLKVTHTENLPDAQGYYLHLAIRTLEALVKEFDVGPVLVAREV